MHGFAFHGLASFTPHIAVFLGLIALGFGYWICLQAKLHKDYARWGRFLGIFISVVAVLGLVCILYLSIKRCCLAQKGDWHKNPTEMMEPLSHPPVP